MVEDSKSYVNNIQSRINNEFVYDWLKLVFKDLVYEEVDDTGECLVFVQEKPGVIERTYFGNLSILSQAYSLYLFVDGSDTRSRLNALKKLREIGDYVELESANKRLPKLANLNKAIKCDVSIPAYLVDRNEQGYTYHLEITLTYESRK